MGSVGVLAARLGVEDNTVNQFDWAAVESSIGLALPDDYKHLVEIFPDGRFQAFVRLIRPGAVQSPPTEYLGYYAYRLEDMRGWRQKEPARFPHPIFPEPGGLLPWGVSHRADLFFWLTDGDDPNKWPVVLADQRFEHWASYEGPVCAFLDDVVSGRFDGTPFDIDLGGGPFFQPTPEEPVAAPTPSVPGWGQPGFTGEHPHDATVALTALVPPAAPRRSIDWAVVQTELGGALPADYRAFMEIYGPGTFCDITIVAPEELPGLIERTYRKAVSNPMRLPQVCVQVFPEPNGMIPWGWTADGWTCGWLPSEEDPDTWGTVLADPDVLGHKVHAGHSLSSLLLEYAATEEGTFALGRSTPWQGPPRFVPLS
ncbi:hypothetical protein [Lentzea albidocapillata]|uniref:Knr4/Smi1-like domain-containing protein n=1 Tax=Lentzea albidocapillata TaxID=40571 RepID=A0A1W2FTI0_9PSEU|nr:hypothetical protein [Lentzea albidocapillata]SMD25230.1 hypothetical protein SAMN05660733_08067 [Lentzea albidocapillata]